MGTVWEARNRDTSEVVAIKVLHAHLLDSAAARKRFVREVESASYLQHPHSVRVLERGETDDGCGFLVMERLTGRTLHSLLRSHGPLPQARAIRIAERILDAVGAAHRLGIVHRDLKPSNVMLVDRDGDPDFVKVCDFGLAKAIAVEQRDDTGAIRPRIHLSSSATQVGELCGTPGYMSPEQACGDPVDARTDLYAIGVLLFESLTGRLPFSGRSILSVLSAQLTTDPPRPSSIRPDLQIFSPLEQLVLRALAKDRAERPSSAEVFRADLLQIGRDLAQRARTSRLPSAFGKTDDQPPTLTSTTRSEAHGAQGKTRAVAYVVSGLLSAAVLATLYTSNRRPPPPHAGPHFAEEPVAPPSASIDPPQNAAAATVLPDAADELSHHPARLQTQTSGPRPGGAVGASTAAQRTGTAITATEGAASATDTLQSAEALLSGRLIVQACAEGQIAATREPESAAVWEFLGRCYMRLGEPDRARAYYRKYLSIAPTSPKARFIRAIVEESAP
jgi:serine/threonine protein kinase